jgi:thiamine biosynthesis lipoprotein
VHTLTARLLAFATLAAIAACGESPQPPTVVLQGTAMGTSYTITLVDPLASLPLTVLRHDIEAEIERIEALASTYRPESELSLLNASPADEWIPVSAELFAMLANAKRLSEQSNGAFDPTVGPLIDLWGFGAIDRDTGIPTQIQIERAMRSVGYRYLALDSELSSICKTVADMSIDLSGWAKGYAVDRLAELLAQSGAENYLVEIGGEIRAKGHNASKSPFVIGIEEPIAGEAGVHTRLRISDAAIATSGDYRNFFMHNEKRYSHTIDPQTGWPVHHELASVTVIDDSAARADGLATALLVLGLEAGMAIADENDIAALFISVTATGSHSERSNALRSRFGESSSGL